MMKKITRRQLLSDVSTLGFCSLAGSMLPVIDRAYALGDKVTINVGYLPITDHLILPVSHALDNKSYKNIVVRPFLCRSWDEILGKMDMGLLNAAFLLAPLAMETYFEKNMRCVLLGHRDGSVIAASTGIDSAGDLRKVTIGVPHQRSTHAALLYKYFRDNGIADMHGMKLKKVPSAKIVEQVRSGKIKAYSVAEPWGLRGVSDGAVHILEYSKNILPGHACCLVMIQTHFLHRKKEAVAEWVESLEKAGETIHRQPDEAAQLQVSYMQHSADDVLQVLENDIISYRSLRPEKATLQTIHDLAFDAGLIHDRVQMHSFIDARFV